MSRQNSSPAASPCIDVCQLDVLTGLCQGCWRTMDEISAWRSASDGERCAILQRVAERKAATAADDLKGRAVP